MEARKLPSGSWRCQVYSHTEDIIQPDGTVKRKRIYKSFTNDNPTAKGKRECEKAAAMWAAGKENRSKNGNITFHQALDNYIEARENILSPRTIMDYRLTQKKYIQSLMGISVENMTQEDIQKAINIEAMHLSGTLRSSPEGSLRSAMPFSLAMSWARLPAERTS